MPIYEYQCTKCGHQFEKLQKVSDPVTKKCPECGALKAKRLVSAAGFQLKGTGWYETDFKNKGKSTTSTTSTSDTSAKGDADNKGKKSDGSKSTESGKQSSKKGA